VAKLLQISPLALSDVDRKVLGVAVNLLTEEGIFCSLLPKDIPHGHLLVINHDSDDGPKFLSQALDGQVKLLLTSENISGKNVICIERPIRVAELADVLTHICLRIKVRLASKKLSPAPEKNAEEKNTVKAKPAATVEVNEKEEVKTKEKAKEQPITPLPPKPVCNEPNLFLQLLQAKQQKYAMAVHGPDETIVLIGGHNSSVAARSSESIQHILHTPTRNIFSEKIDVREFDELSKFLTLSALDNLLWLAGVEFSHGQLLPGHSMDHPVKLKAWPNFTRNGFRRSQFKLAASMASQSISLTALADSTGVPQEEVIDFYNAAFAVGLINREAETHHDTQKTKHTTSRKRGLMGMIARKLGLR